MVRQIASMLSCLRQWGSSCIRGGLLATFVHTGNRRRLEEVGELGGLIWRCTAPIAA
jgi:hypothetical protein